MPAFYDNETAALSDPDRTPLGYRRDNLPNPDDMVANPCYTLTVEHNSQYVELAVSKLLVFKDDKMIIMCPLLAGRSK